ncbi:uncharacterized protein LOC119741876 [Patiria miniata]|uniref:PR domain zinc finger protein 4 n=1 Tax=Patiria miniata TaxID=46514 RepID=A0A914BCJ6_PATMI|nr:uncharacterized protein LOC119741876 [Patiria miniata]XP_038073736.1 uncharacterized protein LOC119741876 [Patiria miniata]
MMSDSLAAINVDQLSNAVSAVVNGTQGQSHNAGSASQTTMGLQMPTTNTVPNTVMVHVDRQLLSQLAFPHPGSTGEVSNIDGTLLQNSVNVSGGFQTGNSQQQSRLLQPITLTATPPTTSQNTLVATQMMGPSAATNGQVPSSIQNVALMNAVQMLNAPHSNVGRTPAATHNAPMNQVVGTQMMIPSILTSMVPAATSQVATQSTPQNALLGTTGLANAFMTKQGGEQMIFNIQPEVARGGNSTNSNNNVLQLVPINNSSSGLSNQQPANQNPMINMSIAIHLPSQGNQDNKDPSNAQKQARTIPLSQLMTGQPIPVSQIAGPIHMAVEHGQDRGAISSGGVHQVSQFGSPAQGVNAPQMAGQLTGNIVQSQMSIPLSQLAVAQAIPFSQITTHLSDSSSQSGLCLPNNSTSQHIQIPHSVFQSLQANSVSMASTPFAAATSTTQAITTASQVAAPVSTPAQAPAVMMGQEMQGKSFWNLQSLDQGSQLTSELTSSLAPSLTSQTHDGSSVAPITKAPSQTGMDLGMVSISPEGLVSSMSTDDMANIDLGATESIENLAMPFDEEASNIWCVECNHYNPTTCATHGPPTYIPDTEIPCRAKLTLPAMLRLSESLTNRKNLRCGVIAVENIQARSQFGPLIGKVISKSDDILEADSIRIWKIFRNGIASHFIDVSDENQSNWMRYVRLAARSQEQNVVIHQSGGNIYFTTNKQITMGEELRAWYSQEYARWNGVPEKPGSSFQCTQCPMQFLQRRQLSQHLGFKHPDMASRHYKCSLCPRAFVSSTKLQLHMLTHMGLKPYKCSHCGKQFSDPSNLRIHTRIHTEEKKFICDICQKAFRQKIHLISHMTTHTGEKHLKCPYCDLTFSTHSTLIQHRHSHATDKELQCDKCNRKFKTYRILQKHIKTHTSQREFKCQSCSKGFYTRYHAKRHHQKCRGSGGERDRKRDRGREEGGDGERKARKRRGRPMRHLRQTSHDSESSLVESYGTDSHTHQGRNTEHHLTVRRESHPGDDEEPRLGSGDRRELPKSVRRGSHREKERTPRGTFGGHGVQSLDYFVGSVLGSSNMETGLSSAELDQSSEQHKHERQRNSSKKSPNKDADSASKRRDGRPVRQRKMPKRYSSEEDKSLDKSRHTGRNQQGRDRRRGFYNFNIVDAPANTESSPRDQTPRRGSSNDSSSHVGGNPGTSLFDTSHALESGILDDGEDSRGSPSVSFSELMESGGLQNSSWHTAVGVGSLNNTPGPVEQGTSRAVGMLPIGIGLSSSETATLPSLAISQPVDTDSTLQMPSSLYSARSSSLATSSMSTQMRGELTSDVEANEQCDDEERAGTVNDNVEE